jgi:hypothetical protein
VKIVGHPEDAQKLKTDVVRNNGETLPLWASFSMVELYSDVLYAA